MTNPNENKDIAIKDKAPVSVPDGLHHGKELAEAFAGMIALAKDKSVDPASLAQLWQTQKEMVMELKKERFNQDLHAAMSKMPPVMRGKAKKAGQMDLSYAKLEDIQDITTKILAEHYISLRFKLGSEGGKTTAQPIFSHTNGYFEEGGILEVPNDTSGSKSAAQSVGSSATYAMRYALCAALNIRLIDFDDDGAKGVKTERKEPTAGQQKMLIAAWKAAELGMASLTEYMDNLRENNSKDNEFLSKHLSKDGKPYYGKLVEQANAFDDKKGNDNAS